MNPSTVPLKPKSRVFFIMNVARRGLPPVIRRVQKGSYRFYEVDGVPEIMPSVTTVLEVINKPFLKEWAKSMVISSVRKSFQEHLADKDALLFSPSATMEDKTAWIDKILAEARKSPEDKRDSAADVGTRLHIAVDAMIKGEPLGAIQDDIKPALEGFANFQRDVKAQGISFVHGDRMVYSAKYRYAGSMDALARSSNGRLIALDFKTSNRLYPEYALQVAAYAKAIEEMEGKVIQEGWLLRLDKDKPVYELRPIKKMDDAFIAFQAALHLWRCLREDEFKLNIEKASTSTNNTGA